MLVVVVELEEQVEKIESRVLLVPLDNISCDKEDPISAPSRSCSIPSIDFAKTSSPEYQ